MLFSQRQGLTPSLKELQLEYIDDELRIRLWNCLTVFYWDRFDQQTFLSIHGSNMEGLITQLWHSFFKLPIQDIPDKYYHIVDFIREQYEQWSWFRVYDFIESVIARSDYQTTHRFATGFAAACNVVLQEENGGYRIVDGRVTPITSTAEIASIEQTLAEAEAFPGVRAHLSAALRMLSDRGQPDFRNSIKESISAVESACKVLVGDEPATLGAALNKLEEHTSIHGALKSGFSKLYGYTSDADGIRHAMLEEPTVTFSDAKFMLVACSGFVNYLIGKVAEVNDHLQRGWLLYSSRRPLKGDRALTRTDRSWPAAAPVSSPPAPDTERSAGSDPRSNPPCSQSTLATRNDCPNTASSADGGSS